jgi:uncharacterized protein YdiU (UPF0061 family)
MTLTIPFDNSYARLPAHLYSRQAPVPVTAPVLLAFNDALAHELGIETDRDVGELASIFAGNRLPEGAAPLAQAYAGHQFGGFNPQLGDGRAILLGEVVDRAGNRRDIQIKGAGRTPYSRMGDGRAWLGPVLREYLLSEAMHAMGIPTTRALAAVATGEDVYRDTALPGATLARVAASHIRVGTFQYFAARQDIAALRALYDHTRARHFPDAGSPGEMLDQMIAAQADLVAAWMSVGFIHGVMNTDNTALSGETIDYGPAAFMDTYHPVTVYSSIDRHGRYSYDNQARIIVWNVAQLAGALVPLMPDQDAAIAAFTETVNAMPDRVEAARLRRFAAKIGIAEMRDGDAALIDELLALMVAGSADFTNTFRDLAHGDARAHFPDPAGYDRWYARWQARIATERDAKTRMLAANPALIPRNHRVESMIAAAVAGDMDPFHRLLSALSAPFDDPAPENRDLAAPPQPQEVVRETFCGT